MNDLNLPDDGSVRLQVWLAHAGVASRRACETYITDGRITVNGEVVTKMGSRVMPGDAVCVDGIPVAAKEALRYVLLNKPAGYVCSLSDEKNRKTAADILKPHFSERLYNVGRLDMFSSGLILFTNDGDFAAKISHPSAGLEKEYVAETSLPYPRELPARFMKGVRVDDVFYKCLSAESLNSRKIRIVLIEGKNREIRRVIESFDVRVKSLTRTRIAFLSLYSAGDGTAMQSGEFRELSEDEVSRLLEIAKQNKDVQRSVAHVPPDERRRD